MNTRNTRNTRHTLTATASGMAASGIMQTLLANATPRIVDELAVPELYGLVAGSYLIASTVTLPLFAQYADRLGPQRIFVIGHLCFVIGTIAMVPAPSMPAFIAARIMQGVGAGAIAPAALASLGLLLDEQARARAFSQLAVAQVVANVVGGPIGGWFTDGPGWRPGLLTVLPLSLTSLLLATSLPTAEAPPQWWRVSLREQFDLWRIRSLRRLAGVAALVGWSRWVCSPMRRWSCNRFTASRRRRPAGCWRRHWSASGWGRPRPVASPTTAGRGPSAGHWRPVVCRWSCSPTWESSQ